MKKFIFVLMSSMFLGFGLLAQAPFNIALEPMQVEELGGLQSFSYGQNDGKWLLVGGRLDGLHRRQPWATFDIAGHNDQLIVVDPNTSQKWSAPLTDLPFSIQEHLSSTNMNFYQEGDYLYCIGGYGFSYLEDDHITFPYLTAIHVPEVIEAIINNESFKDHVRQVSDEGFQVAGGRLRKIYNVFHLLGGQKFMGRYNPMDHPTFTQEYTNEIRRFVISDDGEQILVQYLPAFRDEENLHRRDYNAEAQILPNGEEAVTLFSGVFQKDVDLPYLNSVTVDSAAYTVNNDFQQYYNHYHCAVVPLYAAATKEMHTVFFGGIAQYYDDGGTLVQDNDVPFVKTIARVTRDSNGHMAEYKLPVEMPTYLGAGSEFILNEDIPHFNNEVLKLDDITEDSTLIGYIFGGINSSDANIFWTNDGTQSSASQQLFKVYLTKNDVSTSVHELNEESKGSLKVLVYPNPNNGEMYIEYYLKKAEDVRLNFYSMTGELIESQVLKNQIAGKNTHRQNMQGVKQRGPFLISIETSYETAVRKVLVQE
jgi:hypothetical protein